MGRKRRSCKLVKEEKKRTEKREQKKEKKMCLGGYL